jgi:cyclin E
MMLEKEKKINDYPKTNIFHRHT